MLNAFPEALRGATIQGWLRKWDATGKIAPQGMDWDQLAAVDAVIMSDADIRGFETAIPRISALVEVLVVTQGAAGALVFQGNKTYHFPAWPVREVDATGAGDVFAAAFLVKYAETRDIARATGFAHAAASFVVEGIGNRRLATAQQIAERYELYQKTV
jgi:sugar/nucleoside kinase (ribokinase family)